MTELDDEVDFKSLGKELAVAVAKDQKYKRENDAKFRAINQKVKTYEEFRDIVEASHLVPLDKADKIGGFSYQQWNTVSSNSKPSEEIRFIPEEKIHDFIKPRTTQDFISTWKRHCSTLEEKFYYLISIEKEILPKLLAMDYPMGEIISALHTCKNMEELSDDIFRILEVLHQTKRFYLLLNFLSKQETEMLHQIFSKLEVCIAKNSVDKIPKLKELASTFNVLV